MGIFQRIFGRQSSPAPVQPPAENPRILVVKGNDWEDEIGMKAAEMQAEGHDFFFGASSGENQIRTGPSMTAQEGIGVYRTFSVIYACIQAKVRAAASRRIRVYVENEDGETEDFPNDHPVVKLLNERPNFYQYRHSFIGNAVRFLQTTGELYFVMSAGQGVEFTADTVPNQIFLANPTQISKFTDPVAYIKAYEYRAGSNVKIWPRDQVVFHKFDDPESEYDGLPPLSAFRRAIISEDKIIEWNNRFFHNNARIENIVSVPGSPLAPEEEKRLLARILSLFGGYKRQTTTAVVYGDAKFTALNLPPKDLDFLSQRGMNWKEALAVMNTPPAVVNIFDASAVRANTKEQFIYFWHDEMFSLLDGIAGALTQIARRFDPRAKVAFVTDDVQELKEGDTDKANRLISLYNGGILLGNEVREELGYESLGEDDGVLNRLKVQTGVGGFKYVDPEQPADEQLKSEPPPALLQAPSEDGEDPAPGRMNGNGNGAAMDSEEEMPPAMRARMGAKGLHVKRVPGGTMGRWGEVVGSKAYRRLAKRASKRQSKAYESRLTREMKSYFAKQKDRVMDRFRSRYGSAAAGKNIGQKDATIDPGEFDPFDDLTEREELARILRPVLLNIMSEGGADVLEDIFPTISSPIINRLVGEQSPIVSRYVKEDLGQKITYVTDETKRAVQQLVKDGFSRGLSVFDVSQSLENKFASWTSNKVFDWQNQPVADFGKFSRAEMIARTEVNGALNFGRTAAAEEAAGIGVAVHKSWLSVGDDRVRESHDRMESETADDPIPLGQRYSNGLMRPHDPGGPAEEVVACRCTEVYTTPDSKSHDLPAQWLRWLEEAVESRATAEQEEVSHGAAG